MDLPASDNDEIIFNQGLIDGVEEVVQCSLCNKEISHPHRHSGYPLTDEDVCTQCNCTRVLPARLIERNLVDKSVAQSYYRVG